MIRVFTTAKEETAKFLKTEKEFESFDSESESPSIFIDSDHQFQQLIGFGGAFTESTVHNCNQLSEDLKKEVIQAYFDSENGNGYTLCRTHLNSCDFSLGNYAYSEVDGDVNLEHFSIEHDEQQIIPFIKEAFRAAGHPINIFASPWSPPAWMKTTGMMNQGGKLKEEYRQVWAEYYCRYIKEFAKVGIPIWGLTVQNEPAATQTWDSCIYTAEEERDFIRDYLGPELVKQGLDDVKVMIWDHNRDWLYQRAKVVLDDPEASKYVWGTGFHWYGPDCFENVRAVHDSWPDKHLIFTEGCQEGGPHLGSWKLGERYARSIINDLNNWTEGWVDWNLVLDQTGGPNHVNNLCSAPIIADLENNKLLYQNSYHYIGHFSRYIKPGARRIVCSKTFNQLLTTAFINPDRSKVVVVLNLSENSFDYRMIYQGSQSTIRIQPRAIQSLIFE